jgi:hypothetical protein
MGATNEIKEVLQDYQLIKRNCRLCSHPLSPTNYLLSYRTNNDTDWTDFEIGKSRGWITIEIELEHEYCSNK